MTTAAVHKAHAAPPAVETAPPTGVSSDDGSKQLALTVGRNVRRLRVQAGHSLERLATLSGVSRAMIGQIETGKSTPTIGLLWKIATALSVPFATLVAPQEKGATTVLRHEASPVLSSSGGGFVSRALFPFDRERRVEFYEVRVAPRHSEHARAHAPGTREDIVVLKGSIEIRVGSESAVALSEGDAVMFEADVPHRYRNLTTAEAIFYLVMTYVETVG